MSFEASRIVSAKSVLLISASVMILGSPISHAQPVISVQDDNPTPGVFNAGDSFSLTLSLEFAPGDVDNRTVQGTSFDFEFQKAGGANATPLTLAGVDRAGSPFDFGVVNGADLSINIRDNGTDPASDLGAGMLFGTGEASGPVILGKYNFTIDPTTSAGDYELIIGGGIDPMVTLFETQLTSINSPLRGGSIYEFTVNVPEPGVAALVGIAFTCFTARRRKS